ncbi:hypothetical protein RirG_250190 [Rhizophagus irregularis DAOM 197198w]|uniref:Uncharacterized protein n=1 Tax=Rhizophagus irregularis (strain DAOM 197198w) TaxID=1432141 RepID=A0A015IFK6_RHIIW|nr:hypothetical protein RirG_250190 [Rhizophagus irregularis DAOM 197198w]
MLPVFIISCDVIRDCLEQRKADVAGLYQPLNPSMNEIQQAITKCIEACLSEQKRGMEIGSKTKLIVNDLTTLRKLLGYGCVSFNSFLETIITSQTPTSALSQQQESPWLSLDAVRFLVWRKDVYSFVHQLQILQIILKKILIQTYPTSKLPPDIQPVLEEVPKWNLLAEILQEIE